MQPLNDPSLWNWDYKNALLKYLAKKRHIPMFEKDKLKINRGELNGIHFAWSQI